MRTHVKINRKFTLTRVRTVWTKKSVPAQTFYQNLQALFKLLSESLFLFDFNAYFELSELVFVPFCMRALQKRKVEFF